MTLIGVLISGRGTNLQALIDAQNRQELRGKIVVVISNKSKALGIERARKAGIPVEIITKKMYPVRSDFDKQLVKILKQARVDLIVLAGFMRILTQYFINEFHSKIINVHPSLLPAFKGVRSQWQAIEHGVKVSGCSTHFVTDNMDDGPIILQKAMPVLPDDTGQTLAERLLPEEHRLLVKSVNLFCEGKLSIEGKRVIIKE
ncbi:MAG: phosphoribosylglycinamide formyltransferase [Candidatus Thorarchaeota archaeon]|nr:phosphoribosylglycinamide formyltransferase [Candidatus Thorarchaeota archaeon]